MRVQEELRDGDSGKVKSLVLTGDGRAEFRRLGYIAPKYDGDDILFFPSRPERHLSIVGKQRATSHVEQPGLSALDALRVFKSNYGHSKFLFLVDMEHFSGGTRNEFERQLEEKLRELSQDGEVDIESLSDGAFRCELAIGSQDILVLATVVGDEFECFEDGLAKLLEIEWGNEVNCGSRDELKQEIGKILSGGKEKSLLEGASRYALEEAFPDLHHALQAYE